MNGKGVQLAKRQWQLLLAVRHAGVALAVGLLLGFLGPFGTGTTLSLAVRYAFWLGLSLFGYACVLAAGRKAKVAGIPASDVIDFLEGSFGAFQRRAAAENWTWDRGELSAALAQLEQHRLIEPGEGGHYHLTELGRFAGEAGVQVESIIRLVAAFDRDMDPSRHAVSGGGATQPQPRFSAYTASKAALVRFTETLAHELKGEGVDVNAMAPGLLHTRLLDEVVAAGPERVGPEFHAWCVKQRAEGATPLDKGAALAVFLASARSDGITGRLLSAVWDDWPSLPRQREALDKSDWFTLRRITPPKSPRGPRAGIHSRRAPTKHLGARGRSRKAAGSPRGPRAGIHSRRAPTR